MRNEYVLLIEKNILKHYKNATKSDIIVLMFITIWR